MKEKILSILIYIIFRIYSFSFRYKLIYTNPEDKKIFEKDLHTKEAHEDNLIYAFFHQQELCLFPFFAGKNIVAMVSQSKDGEIMGRVLKMFGYKLVRGSSSRRAVAAFIECLKLVKKGHKVTMAVDGPRGPIYKVKDGVPTLSKKSGKKIVPLAAKPQKAHSFQKAWNKILLPFPFSKINIYIGPIGFYEASELEKELNTLRNL